MTKVGDKNLPQLIHSLQCGAAFRAGRSGEVSFGVRGVRGVGGESAGRKCRSKSERAWCERARQRECARVASEANPGGGSGGGGQGKDDGTTDRLCVSRTESGPCGEETQLSTVEARRLQPPPLPRVPDTTPAPRPAARSP